MVASTVDSSDKLSLLALQSQMKRDPPGYEDELLLQLRHFQACLSICHLQSSLRSSAPSSTDASTSKELADMVMFLAHVAPSYPQHLGKFPDQILQLLGANGNSLQPSLRRHLTQALILLRNRQMIELIEILPVLMELQSVGDRALRKLAFLHIVHDVRRMNLKHKNDFKNRALQNILFALLQDENEARAKRALVVLCDLHRRKVWVDERTANAICSACFHKSSKILRAILCFLLGYEQVYEEEDDESNSEEDENQKPIVTLTREAVYKAYHKGTSSSRKRKQAKLQRLMRSLKKQQHSQIQCTSWSSLSPLQHLHDPQGFAEKLFSRLQICNERFEVKLMMMKVISRTVGLHHLVLLNFYPFLQKYIEPHQRDVTQLLAAAVQACHDMVPPDAVESLLRQLVNQFVHDRARPEVIAVGLNVVREMCLRMPLIMTRELLQDLSLYKKSHEKAVSSAARSIIAVFRQACPSLLEKRDRGRISDLLVHPKAFGEKVVPSSVPGVELLLNKGDSENSDSDSEPELVPIGSRTEEAFMEEQQDDDLEISDSEDEEDMDDILESGSGDEGITDAEDEAETEKDEEVDDDPGTAKEDSLDSGQDEQEQKVPGSSEEGRKRKIVLKDVGLQSLRGLKKLAAGLVEQGKYLGGNVEDHDRDGILSNEDFDRIRKLQVRQAAKAALAEHGMRRLGKKLKKEHISIPNTDFISEQRVNPAALEAKIHRRREKEERKASARSGREDRPVYGARAAVKRKKTGGLSNREKEKQKGLPLAAKRAKIAKSQGQKRAKRRTGKQFRGKKAWKQ